MDDWKLPWVGGCRCGQVRFKVTAPPMMSMACHCAGCQRMTASAFSLGLMLPLNGFEVTAGEPVLGGLQQTLDHYFCPFCKSWLFTRFDRNVPIVNLRATMLDDHGWFEPFIETCAAEKLPWAATPAKHSFAQFPPPEARDTLLANFAANGARPR